MPILGSQWPLDLEPPGLLPIIPYPPPSAPSTPSAPRPLSCPPACLCPEGIKATGSPIWYQVAPQSQGLHSLTLSLSCFPRWADPAVDPSRGKKRAIISVASPDTPGLSGPFFLCYLKFSPRRFPHSSCNGCVNPSRPPQNQPTYLPSYLSRPRRINNLSIATKPYSSSPDKTRVSRRETEIWHASRIDPAVAPIRGLRTDIHNHEMHQSNTTYGRGNCPAPFLQEDLFPPLGGCTSSPYDSTC